ncbi:ABC transporter permease subunit [Mycoplasma sp. Mirounga ES2805-ORL]|uniref:ABC transporter permease subunit n=1 Tax=Mycoplasma sp. Mirounga ES2805-ORL TaxID=754514 RepID=UPI00197C38E5|nr:ABC transporter permease subunit [Mycoplasma sp. Mirounga ES2805-ORL]QSF13768.1 ABC transporter permease subunit [Mycoplasma sp. Mirounga ES2805-ORL]
MKLQKILIFIAKQIITYFSVIIILLALLNVILGSIIVENYSFSNFINYLKGILTFDYGSFLDTNIKVNKVFFNHFIFTSILALISFILALIISFWIAYFLAKKNKKNNVAKVLNFITFIFSSIPIVVGGSIAVIIAKSINLPAVYIEPYISNAGYTLLSLILPIFVLTITITPLMVLINYRILINIFKSEYYLMAISNGFSFKKIFLTVILRNWIEEFLKKTILIYVYILSYTLLIERFFYIKGQSLLFQYFGDPRYFNLTMYLFLFNIVTITLIKSIIDLSLYFLNIKNDEQKTIRILKIGERKLWKQKNI